MLSPSFITISESALQANLDFIRMIIGKRCKLSSVVKGNAYGHGIPHFVPLAEKCGIDHFSVSNAQEAWEVMQAREGEAAIMIMGMIDNDALEWAIEQNIEYYVFEPDRLEKSIALARKMGKPCRIHLELETGMNRTGLTGEELRRVKQLLLDHPREVVVKGMCTHYAGAESIANYVRIKKQITNFNRIQKWFVNNGIHPERRHTACSAAIISYPSTVMDMVRVGIMQYGYWPSKETLISYLHGRKDKENPLKRVISWHSQVMSVKEVKEGEFIGYGSTYLADSDIIIATVPVGYADGYTRSLSNTGRVLINGSRVGVVGMVNMNMMVVDVTHIPYTKKGDEVVLIGEQDKQSISVASFGELSNQLNYELLTRLPREIPREVVQ